MNILFIDDSEEVIDSVKLLFNKMGHELQVETSAVNVVNHLDDYDVDAIFTDMVMPELTGIDVLQHVNNVSPSLPVILVTGHSGVDSAISAIRLGAFDYIMKPFTYDTLQTCLLRLQKASELNRRFQEEQKQRLKVEVELDVRKKIQSELESKNEKLEQLTSALKDSQTQLVHSEKMAALGTLTAGIAHEINNPISFIRSNLNVLEQYHETLKTCFSKLPLEELELTADEQEKMEFILEDLESLVNESQDGAERIYEIAQNLKVFSRCNDQEIKSFDINDGIESTLKIAWNELKYHCKIEKHFGNLPMLNCCGGEINQVILNLLINAAHAITNDGIIRIETREENDFVYIIISDNGCGIPEDRLEQIFNPFYTTKEVGKGTGLGLAIACKIIDKHKGHISVKSEQGKGTEFTIKLPILDADK